MARVVVYPDLAALRDTAYMNEAIEETGAVLMGTSLSFRVEK